MRGGQGGMANGTGERLGGIEDGARRGEARRHSWVDTCPLPDARIVLPLVFGTDNLVWGNVVTQQ
jgi:hypothetical protein